MPRNSSESHYLMLLSWRERHFLHQSADSQTPSAPMSRENVPSEFVAIATGGERFPLRAWPRVRRRALSVEYQTNGSNTATTLPTGRKYSIHKNVPLLLGDAWWSTRSTLVLYVVYVQLARCLDPFDTKSLLRLLIQLSRLQI